MSTPDTMTPLLSTPWVEASGKALPVRAPLPGAIDPGLLLPTVQTLLAAGCGLADAELGHVDVTGCCFPAEPCTVFHPCLTMAIDDAGRRWIAEVGHQESPGPVWCIFPDPQVAVLVSEYLQQFLAALHEHALRGQTLAWLQDLSAGAHAVWADRRTSALRPHHACRSDHEIRGWLSSLPPDAYVYDLRGSSTVRGWPYGVAGPSPRQYRCGRLPVFAVAASPTEGGRAGRPETTSPVHPIAALSLEMELPHMLAGRRRPRCPPMSPSRRRASARKTRRRAAGIWRRIAAAIALGAVAMPSMAADLVQTLPPLWASAAALSLTLVSAANRPKN